MIFSLRRSLSFPLEVSSPVPNTLRNPGLVDVVHRICGGPRAASGSWCLSLTYGSRPSFFFLCTGPTHARAVLSGQFPFLLGPLRPPPPPPTATDSAVVVLGRAGRVRVLARSSRSKLKMPWRQFCTVQFPSHQFVLGVRSVQFGTRRPRHERAR